LLRLFPSVVAYTVHTADSIRRDVGGVNWALTQAPAKGLNESDPKPAVPAVPLVTKSVPFELSINQSFLLARKVSCTKSDELIEMPLG